MGTGIAAIAEEDIEWPRILTPTITQYSMVVFQERENKMNFTNCGSFDKFKQHYSRKWFNIVKSSDFK